MKQLTETGVLELLKDKKSFVLTGHISPDGDCLGSLLALYESLRTEGKTVAVILDDTVPDNHLFLPHTEVIRMAGEMEDTLSVDMLVVLDSSTLDRTGRVGELVRAGETLNIDHHVSNQGFTDYRWLDANAAATGELIYRLLREAKAEITQMMATNLYTAIATDCGFFRYQNTRPDTMRYAAELLALGARPAEISEALEETTVSTLTMTANVLGTLEFFADEKIGMICVKKELLAQGESTDDLINYPRKVKGVDVAVMLKEKDDGCV